MKKEKIYFIPGLMTDIRLWKRVIPLLENKFDIVHTAIPNSTDFDEIVNILNKEFKEENKYFRIFIRRLYSFIFYL